MALPRGVCKGDRFNMLTVIEEAEPHWNGKDKKKRVRRMLVQCDCGSPPKIVQLNKIVNGSTVSCGCYQSDNHKKKRERGEYAKSPQNKREHSCWWGMHRRIYDIKFPQYDDYGGRGISICDRWDKNKGGSFWNFLEDMGHKPSSRHSLERVDVNGDYTPENCKWETGSMQIFNRRNLSVNKTGICGVRWRDDISKWSVEIKKDYKKITLGCYTSILDAVEARQKAEFEIYGRVKMTCDEVIAAIKDIPKTMPYVPAENYAI